MKSNELKKILEKYNESIRKKKISQNSNERAKRKKKIIFLFQFSIFQFQFGFSSIESNKINSMDSISYLSKIKFLNKDLYYYSIKYV